MLASLPMYDLPEMRDATDAFWAALAKALDVNFPLSRETKWNAAWHSPELLLSQTCGYPFTHAFKDQLTYVATPHYNSDGCDGPLYRSILFARTKQDLSAFESKTAAFNSRDLMSGMLALKLVFAPLAKNGRYFSNTVETGGHFASLLAVQQQKADICAIDCVTVAYARKYRPAALEGLVEIARSPQVPGLPFVTRGGSVQKLQEALQTVMTDNSLYDIREALLLSGHSVLQPNAYAIIPELETKMQTCRRTGLVIVSRTTALAHAEQAELSVLPLALNDYAILVVTKSHFRRVGNAHTVFTTVRDHKPTAIRFNITRQFITFSFATDKAATINRLLAKSSIHAIKQFKRTVSALPHANLQAHFNYVLLPIFLEIGLLVNALIAALDLCLRRHRE